MTRALVIVSLALLGWAVYETARARRGRRKYKQAMAAVYEMTKNHLDYMHEQEVMKETDARAMDELLGRYAAAVDQQAADGREIARLERKVNQKEQMMKGRLVSDLPSRRRKDAKCIDTACKEKKP